MSKYTPGETYWITNEQLRQLAKRGRSLAAQSETREFDQTYEQVLTQSTVQTNLVFEGKEVPVIWAKTGNRTKEACEFVVAAIEAGATFKSAWEAWENQS